MVLKWVRLERCDFRHSTTLNVCIYHDYSRKEYVVHDLIDLINRETKTSGRTERIAIETDHHSWPWNHQTFLTAKIDCKVKLSSVF